MDDYASAGCETKTDNSRVGSTMLRILYFTNQIALFNSRHLWGFIELS